MKDMKEDYLWDRSGEPDPELQKLDEILGTLRYQPQPLSSWVFGSISTDQRLRRRWKRDETRKLSKNQSRPHATSHQAKEFRKPLHQRARGTIESPLPAISSLPGGRLSFAEIPANRS
jgi:hypothetical protein